MIRSASCTLETRWAMISLVVSGISSLNALRIFASVAVSTALVLSSRIRIFGFFQNCPGNTESLLLSTRYIISTLFDVRLIFLWKSFNKFICTCQFTRFYALFICGIFISPPQIFQNRAGEKNILLKYNCYLVSQRFHVIFSDISATDKNFSLCHIIQTTDQIDQTGLCTSCSPDDPDCLS